ncbi:ornithine cyclodeaminase family protein [Phenylobacterium sp.]|jgi:ornithine cyclodeaminase|uniref:ornithine cyclodeaminase family protein n=1 Tax=Phenylobacterium sp. TaxID=1871053 RepID=UPI002F41CA5C
MDGSAHSDIAATRLIGPAEVRRRLTYEACIPAVRQAMADLSAGRTRQLLRTHLDLGPGRIFGLMPGALAVDGYFGAKLVSVFADPARPGRSLHRGVVVLFEAAGGRPVCVADAEEITAIRTAAASAVATDALARPDAAALSVLGCGRQAEAHVRAIGRVRALRQVTLWGRDPARAATLAERLNHAGVGPVRTAASVAAAVADADIVCATTGAVDPILQGAWLNPGVHVNLVGSSGPAQAEADAEVVRRARYIVDSRESALAKAAEFLRAREAGVVGDDHLLGEIGEVLLGRLASRTGAADITVYKSVGHAVQDLAAAAYLYESGAGAPTAAL